MKTASKVKHTPGPWTLEAEDDPQSNIYGCGELLATAYPMKRDGLHNSWKANARLIARAPELLKCLDKFVTILKEEPLMWNSAEDDLRAAQEVIKKARGE